jgi:hypothetical protein
MKKEITVGYQNREGVRQDLIPVPKITLANHLLKNLCGFFIGDKVLVRYLPGEIIISKLKNHEQYTQPKNTLSATAQG